MISAYLTVYNDWEFLSSSLRSIAPYVDELVVVDGAYDWMAPYLSALGHDVHRSDPRVYDAIQSSGIPYRVISRVWQHQMEKRIAGYSACSGRFVLRIDSDEIAFFDEGELARFQSRDGDVAEIEMPTYIAPGWIAGPPPGSSRLPRQAVLFNRERVSPEIHLNYLWLVRDVDKLPLKDQRPFAIYRDPVGYFAHLTIWRAPPCSVFRAESYTLNHMLRNGVPWLPSLKGRPLDTIDELLQLVPAERFRNFIEVSRIAFKHMAKGVASLRNSPLDAQQESLFAGYYPKLLAGHAALNRKMTERPQHFVPNVPIIIDISDEETRSAVTANGELCFSFQHHVRAAKAELRSMLREPPWQVVSPITADVGDRRVALHLPPADVVPGNAVRCEIELRTQMKRGAAETFLIEKRS